MRKLHTNRSGEDRSPGEDREIVALAGAVHEVRDYLKEAIALRPTLDDHELRLRALESKRG